MGEKANAHRSERRKAPLADAAAPKPGKRGPYKKRVQAAV